MGRVCTEVQEWIEEQVERPIEEWERRQEERCRRRRCKWWCLCCNIMVLLVGMGFCKGHTMDSRNSWQMGNKSSL